MTSGSKPPPRRYRFDDLTLDTGQRRLRRGEDEIQLSKLSFDLLRALVEAAPNLLTPDQLTETVWGPRRVITPENLSQRVMMLRHALGEHAEQPRYIEAVRSQGYRLMVEVETVESQGPPDVRLALEGALETGLSRGTKASGSSNVLRLAGAVAVTAVVAGVVAGWFLRPLPAPEPGPVVRFSVPLPPEQSFTPLPLSMIALSPDGSRIAYSANDRIFLRSVGEREVVAVTSKTDLGDATPAFSPDGQWLAYVHFEGDIGPYVVKRVPLSGGAPAPIYEADVGNLPSGLTWPTPDTLVFANAEGIVRIPTSGGATEVLVPRGEDERFDSPQILPGGETVLFTRRPGVPASLGGFEAAQVVVQSIGKSDRTVVREGASAARYLPTGHLVYAQGTTLFAVPFDPAARAARGAPVAMLEGLRRSSNGYTDAANFAVSATGTLVMIPGDPNAVVLTRLGTTLHWVDREGREEPFPVRPDDYTQVRISPDGTQVALVIGAALGRPTRPSIWLFDLRTENLRLLTADTEGGDGPVWSSDGARIFFRSSQGGTNGVYAIEVDTGETTLVAASPDYPFALAWTISPDDRTLGLVNRTGAGEVDIATLSLADGEFARLLDTEAQELEPSIAPNGAWLAYVKAAPGGSNAEINLRPFPDVSRTRILVGPGRSPVFSRDGAELFFVGGGGLWVASVTYEPALSVGAPRRLFASAPRSLWMFYGQRVYDVDPSGERFLMARWHGASEVDAPPERRQIDVVLNWFEELKSRVPTE